VEFFETRVGDIRMALYPDALAEGLRIAVHIDNYSLQYGSVAKYCFVTCLHVSKTVLFTTLAMS